MRFSICQTDKPPVGDDAGSPPIFLGNVAKLHATVHPMKRDKWEFANKDDLDPGLSCYVKCGADEMYQDAVAGSSQARRRQGYSASGAPTDQLYLFVELIATVRCRQDVQLTRKGVVRSAPGSPKRDREKDLNKTSGRGAEDKPASRFGFTMFGNRDAGANGKPAAPATRNGRGRDRDGRDNRDRQNEETEGDENDEPPSPNRRDDRDRDDDRDRPRFEEDIYGPLLAVPVVEMCAGWVMIPIAAALSASTPVALAALARAGETSLAAAAPPPGPAQPQGSVSAASAASMPLTRTRKLTFTMRGGSATGNVGISKDEVVKRSGVIHAFRRAIGVQQKSIIEVLVKPVGFPPPTIVRGAQAYPQAGYPQAQGGLSLAPDASAAPPSEMMTSILPSNVVLPSNSISCVSCFRTILSSTLTNVHTDRMLPQTGSLPYADVLLSSFPRMLADPAASRVLFALWSKEAPAELCNRPMEALTLADVATPRVQQAFRDVVLRVYRAFSSPDAMPDKLNPIETAEHSYQRERVMRQLIGMPEPGSVAVSAQGIAPPSVATRIVTAAGGGSSKPAGPASAAPGMLSSSISRLSGVANTNGINGPTQMAGTANMNASLTGQGPLGATQYAPSTSIASAPLLDHLYTPFNARELVVPHRNII